MPRAILVVVRIVRRDESQLLRHRHPHAVPAKRLLVPIEVLQTLARDRVAVHGRVLLVPEGDAGAGDALAAGLGALRAYRALLATLELSQAMSVYPRAVGREPARLAVVAYLPLSAGEAVGERKVSRNQFGQHV